jgi:hypothetical protein
MSPYQIVLLCITGVGALGCFVFVTTYWVKAHNSWMRTEPGRFLMLTYGNLGLLFLLVIANQIFDTWPGQKVVTLLLFLAFVIQSWWPLRLLMKYNGRADRSRDRRVT